jgi:phosphinothricin acetyltransferase
MEREMLIEAMRDDDWPEVRRIYLEGLETGDATFETEAPTWERWDIGHRPDCRLVARARDEILGWAALSPISSRRAYAGVAEVSIYVAAAARGRGVGKALLNALITESERAGVWTLQASIFPENVASVRLHKQEGFREVGRREAIAQRSGIWRDTLLLERRSLVAG